MKEKLDRTKLADFDKFYGKTKQRKTIRAFFRTLPVLSMPKITMNDVFDFIGKVLFYGFRVFFCLLRLALSAYFLYMCLYEYRSFFSPYSFSLKSKIVFYGLLSLAQFVVCITGTKYKFLMLGLNKEK